MSLSSWRLFGEKSGGNVDEDSRKEGLDWRWWIQIICSGRALQKQAFAAQIQAFLPSPPLCLDVANEHHWGLLSKSPEAATSSCSASGGIERICTLSMDEISLKKSIDYDASLDQVQGLLRGQKGAYATVALMFLVSGMKMHWKQAFVFF